MPDLQVSINRTSAEEEGLLIEAYCAARRIRMLLRHAAAATIPADWIGADRTAPERVDTALARLLDTAFAALLGRQLPAIRALAKHYLANSHTYLDYDDLVQEGRIALVRALESYDPARGFRLSTYASGWERRRIGEAATFASRSVRMSAYIYKRYVGVISASRKFAQRCGRQPTVRELSDATRIAECDLRSLLAWSRNDVISIHNAGEKNSTILDYTVVGGPGLGSDASRDAIDGDRALRIDLVLETLSTQERQVVRLRYGLIDGRGRTLEEVGRALNVSATRIRQIEKVALQKLKHPARSKKLKELV